MWRQSTLFEFFTKLQTFKQLIKRIFEVFKLINNMLTPCAPYKDALAAPDSLPGGRSRLWHTYDDNNTHGGFMMMLHLRHVS